MTPPPAKTSLQTALRAAETAAAQFDDRGLTEEAAVSRCMASHYREALGETESTQRRLP